MRIMSKILHLLLFILFSLSDYAQSSKNIAAIRGKNFVDSDLDYFKIVNDSILQFSLEKDSSFFYIFNDSIFIKDDHWSINGTNPDKYEVTWKTYLILKANNDSLIIVHKFRRPNDPDSFQDTLSFVELSKMMIQIEGFKELKFVMAAPFAGKWNLAINKSGEIKYLYQTWNDVPGKLIKQKISGKFSNKEFDYFKNLLCESLFYKLPAYRNCSGTDQMHSTLTLKYKEHMILSKGCDFSYLHSRMVTYLLNLDSNSGFIKRKKFKSSLN